MIYPKKQYWVDIENNFEPKYINIRGKGELISELKRGKRFGQRFFLLPTLTAKEKLFPGIWPTFFKLTVLKMQGNPLMR